MIVAGIGFRGAATLDDLQQALRLAAGSARIDALATAATKADAPQIRALAERLGLPLHAVDADRLAAQQTQTHSARVAAQFGTGSLAEAAALAVAGAGAVLLAPRAISGDGMATAALAEGPDT